MHDIWNTFKQKKIFLSYFLYHKTLAEYVRKRIIAYIQTEYTNM